MMPDKSVLLEQINTVIRNSYKDSPDLPDFSLPGNLNATKFSADIKTMRTSFLDQRNRDSFIQLEQRVEALEDQNNCLLYFIHFLSDNFPDLVRNIMPGEKRSLTDKKEPHPVLTKREVEVLDLLVKGLCAKEIADSLYISETTVITHKKNLKKKYNVRNTVELISKVCNY